METNILGTHPSGDTIQDGPCTGLDHAEKNLLNFNGGKTPGTVGEWTLMVIMTLKDN